MILAVTMAVLSFGASEAQASTYMWGVGPRLGTMVWPMAFPTNFPKVKFEDGSIEVGGIYEDDNDERDSQYDSTIKQVRGDVFLGFEGEYWAGSSDRFGAIAGLGFAGGYSDANIVLKWDRMKELDALDAFFGLGIGMGSYKFTGENEEMLKSPYYLLRAQAGLLKRDSEMGYQGLIYFSLPIPSNQIYFRDSYPDGNVYPDGVDVDWGFTFAPQIGLEIQLLFGDLKPPSKKKKKKSKK